VAASPTTGKEIARTCAHARQYREWRKLWELNDELES
jgi:hypothetical protein